jgi:hypothetical protein
LEFFESEIIAFKAGIDNSNLSRMETREAFMSYFHQKYKMEDLTPIRDDLNYFTDCYFPLKDEDYDQD